MSHFNTIGVNIYDAIHAPDKATVTVTVTDIYARPATIEFTITQTTNTYTFCRIQGFF
ncbi:TPA: hypothetical protein LT061_002560 [Salmonella enterica subsp. enterica serovar Blitta]|nr:hypothetical protein [Salmonella enterica subsp. enterica serovar Blitta]